MVVFNVEGRDIPIVHRVSRVHEAADHSFDALTKVFPPFTTNFVPKV